MLVRCSLGLLAFGVLALCAVIDPFDGNTEPFIAKADKGFWAQPEQIQWSVDDNNAFDGSDDIRSEPSFPHPPPPGSPHQPKVDKTIYQFLHDTPE